MLFWFEISRLNEESDDNQKLFVDKLKMINVADIKKTSSVMLSILFICIIKLLQIKCMNMYFSNKIDNYGHFYFIYVHYLLTEYSVNKQLHISKTR